MRSVAAALLLTLALTGFSSAPQAEDAKKAPSPVKIDHPLLSRAPIKGDFVLGNKDAPVKLVEYASLSCPHCAAFHKQILPKLEEKYIKTGKLAYIFRHYPLNEPALKGALLVECVGEKEGNERYFTFLRVLFDAQGKWAFDANFLASLETFANVGGVSPAQFKACTSDGDAEMRMLRAKKEATDALKIEYTPYLFINGWHPADVSYESLSAFIDKELATSAPKSAPKEPTEPKH